MSFKNDMIEQLVVFKVLLINLAIIGGVTIADLDIWLKIVASIVAISYTCYKFYNDLKSDKQTRK